MTTPELKRRITLALTLAVAAPGCAGGEWPDDTWELPTCTAGAWTPLASLEPAAPPDWLRLATAGADSPAEVSDELGAPCSGATDPDACAAAVATLEGELDFTSHLLSTAGDDARSWVGRGEVGELLGTIDNPDEALSLAWAGDQSVTCGDLEQGAQRVSPDGGFDVVTTSYRSICAPIVRVRTLWHVTEDGAIDEVSEDVIDRSMACIGRRPPGLAAAAPSDTSVGAWLARAAELEAAAVPAFERLVTELEAFGAPEALVQDARDAADDERRHVVQMSALAHRYGREPLPRAVAPLPLRGLRAFALDNAVEGCVREAWGAALGAWQARTATDPEVAATLAAVADDELGHAALSLRIAAWVDGVADDALRSELVDAANAAREALRRELAAPLPAAIRAPLGLPDADQGLALFSRFEQALAA
jgi:hypothetical protein